MFEIILDFMKEVFLRSGYAQLTWQNGIMLLIAVLLILLAILKKFEPLLLLPMGLGMLVANIPLSGMTAFDDGKFLNILYQGVTWEIFPPLIFLGVGAMIDFAPLIANPSSFLMGASAQIGIMITFLLANLVGFTSLESAALSAIGGADGPTTILLTTRLAPHLLPSVAIAAYSYMALVPLIQPPVMKLLTTKKERSIVMKPQHQVTKIEKIIFPIVIITVVCLLVPDSTPLIGSLMIGNLIKESGVTERLANTLQTHLLNTATVFLALSVGASATAERFLTTDTLQIIFLGLFAFVISTACGVLCGKVMCFVTKGKINPLIGAASVSAMPMSARVVQKVGQQENPGNHLLMHAMGPNVSGTISTAILAGIILGKLS
ncbi:sodium ion-translocating decarboxylase subunit beta [Scatolibacter rhodanostii]|uniref:sodium ion-translocating decarboxylase subunit beta n=1 Tax=Scatolibacter rhodanostii TaxID=2014781 RepID=UPI000C07FBBD|nr:sodium ion-translocating decarboxylase subunit beta [Scatolibacter rhodanostii]